MAETDKVTHRNGASAQGSAWATEEMSGQAKQMKEAVEELMALMGRSGNRIREKNIV